MLKLTAVGCERLNRFSTNHPKAVFFYYKGTMNPLHSGRGVDWVDGYCSVL
jgi:hypothetical protein